MKEDKSQQELLDALTSILQKGEAATQEQICKTLQLRGYEINQSKVSRLLRKINAVKVVNSSGHTIYSLPWEPAVPTIYTPLKQLIVDVVFNETLVVIYTSPGSASMVARILDFNQMSTEVLGTIAGDDTIFVAPKSGANVKKLAEQIKKMLKDTSD